MKASKYKNPKKRKFILLGIGFGVLALGGFGYWYFKGRKGVFIDNSDDDIIQKLSRENKEPISNPKQKASPPKKQNPTPNAIDKAPVLEKNFPLKSGSKNELVKKLQEALIKTYGKNILPKYGADGQFGNEMIAALKSKGFSSIIDETTYNKIVGITVNNPIVTPGLDATDKENIDITKNIWLNLSLKKLTPLIDTLKRINSVPHYIKVNELFKTIRLNGVRQTIVNASLSIFSDDTAKQFIKNEFIRIGLKYDGEKWSLAGLNEKEIISTQETTICSIDGCTLKVPSQTILGIQLTRGKHNTRFRTFNNQILYVPTKHINHV